MTEEEYIEQLRKGYQESQDRGEIHSFEIRKEEDGYWLYLRPIKPVPYIYLNFTAIKTNVSFEEVISGNVA